MSESPLSYIDTFYNHDRFLANLNTTQQILIKLDRKAWRFTNVVQRTWLNADQA